MGPAFHSLPAGAETVGAVVLGALLATAGGIVATHLEARARRRERERTAALLFGEILAAMEIIAPMAVNARSHGERYGPWTLRLLRTLRRETETFDRYRDLLYDIRDADMRMRLYTLMVRLGLSLDGVFETSERLTARLDDEERAQAERARDAAFEFVTEIAAAAAALITRLAPIARHGFDAQRALGREYQTAPASPAAGPD
ncbi:MAG TPA: hypothetical protein VG248_09370 [Caulobacteraceae bacterium]|jgi:hypothetical protein|nr:hypothetical protein [Caulobacteraceae bacterium]